MANIGERDIFIYLFDLTRLVQLGVKTSLKGDICKKVCETEPNGKEMLYGGIKWTKELGETRTSCPLGGQMELSKRAAAVGRI